MIKTLKNLLKQDKERYSVPRKVQDIIPIQRIWKDGIFQVGNRFSKTYKFSDINYLVASREDKEAMFLAYSELLNSLDSGATTKITINNRRLNKANFEQSILMPMRGDSRDVYRKEYNQMLLDKATGANGIIQEKYITISVAKKDIEEARTYFARVGADLISHFAALGSKCTEMHAGEKLRVLHDFYRQGEEAAFHFDPQDMMKKGHDFKDYICPDSIEKNSDYLKLGDKYCRVLFLKDYASYIKDSMVTELTDFNRNMMLSIDVVPVPTDEAVREVENRLLGVETNITNWQRRQNANNNFSAVVPYDMELQRKESKEFLDDLTTRDQRMMFAVITMVITADDKKQLDSDTETVLSVARKHMLRELQITKELFEVLNRFELDDLSILNEWDRHYEHSELTEISLYSRAAMPPESVEETVFRNLRYEALHRAIKQLPEVQRRRLILYYFMGLTYAQIAEKEGCTFQAIGKSISAAEKRLKKILE